MSANLRRRGILAAALASAAAPGALARAETLDPIFAMITAHRVAEAGYCEVISLIDRVEARRQVRQITQADYDMVDERGDRAHEVLNALTSTVPTTLGGVCALLTYVTTDLDWDGDELGEAVASSLKSPAFEAIGGTHV